MRDPFQKFEREWYEELTLRFGGGAPPPPATIITPPPPPPPVAPAIDQTALNAATQKQASLAAKQSGRASTFLSNQSGRMSTILSSGSADKLGG